MNKNTDLVNYLAQKYRQNKQFCMMKAAGAYASAAFGISAIFMRGLERKPIVLCLLQL